MDPRVQLAELTDGGQAAPVLAALDRHRIIVSAPPERCITHADQAALLNATNLLGRMFAHVDLRLDDDAPCDLGLGGAGTLGVRLRNVLAAVGTVSAAVAEADLHLAWGHALPGVGVAADAAGWTYALGLCHTPLVGAGEGVAFGGLAATALAAGQLLGRVLAPFGVSWHEVDCLVANLLDYSNAPAPAIGPVVPALGPTLLAGAGSVGSSVVYAALLSGVVGGPLDAVDPDKLSDRNRLRYPALLTPAGGPKVEWLAKLALGTQLTIEPHPVDIAGFLAEFAEPPMLPLVLSSVDTVEGRRDATDLLAGTTLNAGVAGLQLHIAAHGFGGDDGCAFCQYVDVEPALEGAAMLAQALGLPVERVLAIGQRDGRLNADDAEAVMRAGVLAGSVAAGDRLDDLHRRAYAQATLQMPGQAPLQVSAPHVSAMAGLLLLVEAVKHGTPELAPYRLHGRFDVDMSGQPPGFVLPTRRDITRRCLCWSEFRRAVHRRLHERRLPVTSPPLASS